MTPYRLNTEFWPDWPGVTWAGIAAELAREAAYRARVHEEWVNKGRLSPQERDYQRTVWSALQEDAQRQIAGAGPNGRHAPAQHGVPWQERRAALLRELDFRARLYPGWIAKGNITQAQANRQCAALHALLQCYDEGFDWPPPNGHGPAWASITPTPEQKASRAAWHAFRATLDAGQNQGALRL